MFTVRTTFYNFLNLRLLIWRRLARVTCCCLSRERSGPGFAACGPMHQVRHDAKLEHNYFLMENLGSTISPPSGKRQRLFPQLLTAFVISRCAVRCIRDAHTRFPFPAGRAVRTTPASCRTVGSFPFRSAGNFD